MKQEKQVDMTTALEQIKTLKCFIAPSQMSAMADGCRGEEKDFFFEKFAEIAGIVEAMPKIYETDGQGAEAIARLHYFGGAGDWYIVEKDSNEKSDPNDTTPDNSQCFGLVSLDCNYPEAGYISLPELLENEIELDLFWTPKTIGELTKQLIEA